MSIPPIVVFIALHLEERQTSHWFYVCFLTTLWPGSTTPKLVPACRNMTMPIADLAPFLDQDPQKEECQEGYPVLPDGLWRVGNWYVASHSSWIAID